MSWKITFEIIGDHFSPSKINIQFDEQNEPGEIEISGRYKGTKLNYGSASFVVKKEMNRLEKFKHLANTFEPLLPLLKDAGAESWHISIGRLYFGQCNEELDANEITQIAKLQCSISYSAYSVSEEEEMNGFD